MHAAIKLYQSTLAITVLAFASAPVAHAQPYFTSIPPETVLIGNANNPADSTTYGKVDYDYYIGKSEVTNAQYAAFLNSVATNTDTYGLYNADMGSQATGGITRNADSGSYLYTVKQGYETKPVNYVSFYDAARFCNWLTNGANADASTEIGMYTLANGATLARNQDYVDANGGWAITSEDEWYKAAYYKPGAEGANAQGYTDYATGSSISQTQANYANSYYNAHGKTDSEYIAPAGSYGSEQNDTYDMMGNLWEWNEAISADYSNRGLRAGSYYDAVGVLASSYRNSHPLAEYRNIGFRVVQLVAAIPEPSTCGILGGAAALLGAIALRRRNRRD